MDLTLDELGSDQAFTVIRVDHRDTLAAFLGQSTETILLDSRPGLGLSPIISLRGTRAIDQAQQSFLEPLQATLWGNAAHSSANR